MASITDKELILHCTQVNSGYMSLPAGQVRGYEAVTRLYQRIAAQSLACAQAWLEDKPCPPHEPATSAFWWANVAWAIAFGQALGMELLEWYYFDFVRPHYDFAYYLRPYKGPLALPPALGEEVQPARVIILWLDARWMALVIGLTARWGLIHHLKDFRVFWQSLRLMKVLKSPKKHPVSQAYLVSDIAFLRDLFKPFPFELSTRQRIEQLLIRADAELKEEL